MLVTWVLCRNPHIKVTFPFTRHRSHRLHKSIKNKTLDIGSSNSNNRPHHTCYLLWGCMYAKEVPTWIRKPPVYCLHRVLPIDEKHLHMNILIINKKYVLTMYMKYVESQKNTINCNPLALAQQKQKNLPYFIWQGKKTLLPISSMPDRNFVQLSRFKTKLY